MKQLNYIFYCMLLIVVVMSACDNDDSFDNKLYIKGDSKVSEILLTGAAPDEERTIRAELAKPAEQVISITYKVDPALLETYNQAYYDNAELLPEANYEWIEPKAQIAAGAILSTDAKILFKDFASVDREKVYVLPVTIADADIDILKSARNYYFVIKGAALINVVADIEDNYLSVNWRNPAVVNNLSQVTMEALIRARNFDKMISTVMGIEGQFLIRIGDANFPSNQIQIATGAVNFPAADSNKGLPTNKWVHIALTYDTSTQEIILYVNGRKQSEGSIYLPSVSLGSSDFFIGRSYDDNRSLAGDIAECRIWNVVRTPEEIAANPYMVDPQSEGLVAYWKFNEGVGTTVKDHTANGNNAVSNAPLKWTAVSLPEATE